MWGNRMRFVGVVRVVRVVGYGTLSLLDVVGAEKVDWLRLTSHIGGNVDEIGVGG